MSPGDTPNTAPDTRRDILAGLKLGGVIAAVALAALAPFYGSRWWHSHARAAAQPPQAVVAPVMPPTVLAAAPLERKLDLGDMKVPVDVTQVAGWAVRKADNGDLPFAVIDKRRAQVYVFAVSGKLLGTSPVLLGYAAGDYSVAGIGTKAIADIKPQERTTPAGRFESHPGRNSLGDDVVWVDYDAAVSMHKVRLTNPAERRAERLASPSPAVRRISWGCINVPPAFFEQTVWPNLKRSGAVVYVLPETKPLVAFFPEAAAARATGDVHALASLPVTKIAANP